MTVGAQMPQPRSSVFLQNSKIQILADFNVSFKYHVPCPTTPLTYQVLLPKENKMSREPCAEHPSRGVSRKPELEFTIVEASTVRRSRATHQVFFAIILNTDANSLVQVPNGLESVVMDYMAQQGFNLETMLIDLTVYCRCSQLACQQSGVSGQLGLLEF